jgi:arylsulfatase
MQKTWYRFALPPFWHFLPMAGLALVTALIGRGLHLNTPVSTWGWHLLFLGVVALGVTALCTVLPRALQGRPLFWVAVLLQFLLACAYSFDLLCRHAWGDQGNLALALRFRGELPRLFKALGPVAPLGLGAILLWAFLAGSLHARAGALVLRRRTAVLLLILALSLGSGMYFSAFRPEGRWADDPLLGMLVADEDIIPLTPARLHAIVEDRGLRQAPLLPTGRPGHRNLILIVVDAERPDHLSAYGYGRSTTPFLDRELKAGRLKLVQDAFSNGPVSAAGIMGILASRESHNLSPRVYGLGELMWKAGRVVRVYTTGDDLWYGLSDIYGPFATDYIAGTRQDALDRSDDRVVLQGLHQLARSDGAPSFFFIHLMTVHELGIIDPAYQLFQPALPLGIFHHYYSPDDQVRLLNSLDGRVLQADQIIRSCFQELGRKGYLKDAVVLITADHGQLYGEHGDYGHSEGRLWDPSLRIPMMVWGAPPPELGRLRGASTLDVAPSLAEWAGIVPPASWVGVPLSQPEHPRILAQEHVTTAFGRGAITQLDGRGGVLKYMVHRVDDATLHEHAFQVDQDRDEVHDVFRTLSPTVRAFFRAQARARLDPGLGVPAGGD